MSDTYQASNVSPADIAAARAAVSGDPLAARASGDALSGDFNQLIQEQRQGAQKLQQIMEAGQRAQAPLRAQALKMARQPMPQPPIAQPLPPTPQRNQPGEDEQWLMAAMVLGAIGGAFTRQHVTNGLAAMTGALEGYQAGSKEKFEQNLKLWKAESEKAKEANDQANTRYRQILESKKMAWDQKMQEIQLVAAQYKDLATMQLVQNGQGEKIGDLTVRRDEASAKMEQMKLQMQRDFAKMQETERHNRTQEALRAQGNERMAEALRYRTDPALLAQRAVATAEPKALASTLTKLTQQKAAIEQYENTAKKNMDQLLVLANKPTDTGVTALNRFIRGGERELGNNDVRNFVNQIKVVEPEVGRILSNPNLSGALTNFARQEANRMFDEGMTPQNTVELVKLLRRDFQNRADSLDDEINDVRAQLRNLVPGQPPQPLPKKAAPAETPGAMPTASAADKEGWQQYGTDQQGNPIRFRLKPQPAVE